MFLPKEARHREPTVLGGGSPRQRLVLGEAGHDGVGPGHVDVLQWVVGGLDAGHVDRLNPADMLQNGVELAGETSQFAVGQGETGQTCQVGDVVPRDLRHDTEA